MEDALRESEARFSLFMDHLPGIAFLKDLHGRYVYVSPGFVKLTGRAPGLCVGSSDDEYWPESAERLRAEDQYVIQTGRALTAEDSRTAGGETRHYETVKFPIPDKDGTTILMGGISVDITHRKAEEETRKALLARLANAQEEERRRISRELHDDLIQRLAAMVLDLDQIASRVPPRTKEGLRSLEQRIVQTAEVARHLAHALHPSELDDLSLVSVLRSYCEDFARREGIAVRCPEPESTEGTTARNRCLRISGDTGKPEQYRETCGGKRVSVILEGTGNAIRLRVKDSGVGFGAAPQESTPASVCEVWKSEWGYFAGTSGSGHEPGKGTEITAEIPLEA